MGFLKWVSKVFGGFFIFIALMAIFTSLFMIHSLDNLHLFTDTGKEKMGEFFEENKDLVVKEMIPDVKIDKKQLEMACKQNPEEMPEDLCAQLPDLETEEDIKGEFVNVLIDQMENEITPQLEQVEEQFNEALGDQRKVVLYIVIPVSIFIFLLGSFLTFVAKDFKWKAALFLVSLKTGILSTLSAIGNYYVMNISPEKLAALTKLIPMADGETPEIALKLMSSLVIDWIKATAGQMFLISIIVAVPSIAIAIAMFFIKKEKKKHKKKKKKK
ncbi:MAG: hypothetical protein L6408_09350 [Nanoarchaeota archaeon]|nr:hypothetical protein [Nanoarchaeota archaeon]